MKFKIIAVGKIKNKPLKELFTEYFKRIRHYALIETIEIKDSDRADENIRLTGMVEREKAFNIALSEDGCEFTSRQFAEKLTSIHQQVTFVIGGPDGLTDETKQHCDMVISLSKMTLTHEMARVILAEQLFRALNILHGGKYHND